MLDRGIRNTSFNAIPKPAMDTMPVKPSTTIRLCAFCSLSDRLLARADSQITELEQQKKDLLLQQQMLLKGTNQQDYGTTTMSCSPQATTNSSAFELGRGAVNANNLSLVAALAQLLSSASPMAHHQQHHHHHQPAPHRQPSTMEHLLNALGPSALASIILAGSSDDAATTATNTAPNSSNEEQSTANNTASSSPRR